ncbi:3-hydroxyacyl-CoA dehydrogenase NAD-binding domain-containing protein [Mesorhizobium tianshanense]|uniref:Short chain enoyl-CoA hydratase /3-hydroxyacyl-CoA dehydrogenase n=1 Tax=Mesorhizobium tianshanense TaxID=39844 RepID=A0A562P2R6_9HYPH|nr:3-hydroxyacyl-CoA dehydrogenase NAD-binding domain-containing protein [Mesorhizobium tianshanense]TWI38768.1 short chain enoyl-CoA hydratase /3-hydroxyacyl-CoA dehydrogenase [Mesorhizobium tianshanense]
MAVQHEMRGDVVVVTINNPPVNALGKAVRQLLLELAEEFDADRTVKAVVLTGYGRVFVGGADITEFEKPLEPPYLPDVVARIEGASKPWIAALGGAAMGGGLELALGCRFRVAGADARFALPEINLGLIPGSGGTQRLPRVIPVDVAVRVVSENLVLDGRRAAELGLVDYLTELPVVDAAVEFARSAIARPLPTAASGRDPVHLETKALEEADARVRRSARSAAAPLLAFAALRTGLERGVEAGLEQERSTFLHLRDSREAAALRYLFFAEKAAPRPADLRDVEPLPIKKVGVVGGGKMGVGIAVALRNAGIPVVLADRDVPSLGRELNELRAIFAAAQKKGVISLADVEARMDGVSGTLAFDAFSDCDLVVEAVFEDLAVKRDVFSRLAQACAQETILATNTSYMDPRQISDGLVRSERFIGLHFFSPAQVMKLLEIVPTPETRPAVIATAFELARRLGKVPVRSGICEGFIGNRILKRYRADAEAMLSEGVAIADIDAAMRGFGYAMGPFEMQDMAGLDISFMHREAARARGESIPETPGDLLVRAGRKGQKSGGGWYDYAPGERTPLVSADAARILEAMLGARPKQLSAEAIVDRLVSAMAHEGQAILDEGIASKPSDIDLVEVHGYGFPRRHGGPMFRMSRR